MIRLLAPRLGLALLVGLVTTAAQAQSLDLEESSSQYASIADASQTGLDLTGDFSLELWVKLERLPSASTDMMLVAKWDTTLNQRNYRLFGQASGDNLVFEVSADGSAVTSHSATAFFAAGDVGAWVHVAVTFDSAANLAAFYRNGVQVSTSDLAGSVTPFNGTAPFAIGTRFADNVAGFFFDGKLDDVRVWNDVRTAQEIADFYLRETTGSEGNLVGYWKLNNDYLDETANNNDLTASGSPVFSSDIPFSSGARLLMWLGFGR